MCDLFVCVCVFRVLVMYAIVRVCVTIRMDGCMYGNRMNVSERSEHRNNRQLSQKPNLSQGMGLFVHKLFGK